MTQTQQRYKFLTQRGAIAKLGAAINYLFPFVYMDKAKDAAEMEGARAAYKLLIARQRQLKEEIMERSMELIQEAWKAAEWRSHSMQPFLASGPHVWNSRCTRCGMGVWVDTQPPANGIDIHGEAVALNCTK